MKKQLLNIFEKSRNRIIDEVFKYVEKQQNKQIILSDYEFKDYNANDEFVVTQIYKRLFIKNRELFVDYEFGKGYEPCEYEKATELLEQFSMNEMYEIIKRIDSEE